MNADEAIARERWSKEGDDDALVRLVNMLLVTMARADATCFRVRSDAEPAIETYGPSGWAPFVDFVPPKKVREPIIWRLKLMAEIAVDAAVMFAAKFKLMLGGGSSGLRDYDVCFSRTASGSRIVVTRVPTVYGWRMNAELVRRATILLAQADEATSRDEVRARAREAVALVPEGDGARVSILQTAAATCGRAGLFDEALSLSSLALPLADDPRERAHVEETIALVHEDTRKLDEAADGYARALATAETMPAPRLYTLSPLVCLADLATERHDLEAAERWLARAEALVSDVFGVASAAHVMTRPARVRLLRARGEATAAESLATEALGEATRFDLDFQIEELRRELADLALSRADAQTAAAHLRAILQVPSRHPGRARVYTMLARALRSLGQDAEALSALRAASALAEGVLASDHPIRLDVERELAQLAAASPYR